MKRTTILVLAAAAAAFGLALAVSLLVTRSDTGTPPLADAARTVLPGLSAATGEPELPALATLRPAAGRVVQVPGPFDGRFVLDNLTFDGRRVAATVRITSDVSDLLELEALAGFYDAKGTLLGTGRYVRPDPARQGHAEPTAPAPGGAGAGEAHRVTIDVPAALRGRAVSAAIGVPVLVNE